MVLLWTSYGRETEGYPAWDLSASTKRLGIERIFIEPIEQSHAGGTLSAAAWRRPTKGRRRIKTS